MYVKSEYVNTQMPDCTSTSLVSRKTSNKSHWKLNQD